MKNKNILLILTSLMLISISLITGCKYDVAEPQWYSTNFKAPQKSPVVSKITPAEAVAGVNKITINGDNLDRVADNRIYLDIPGTVPFNPQVVDRTPTSITILRPNVATDSCTIKLVPDSGLVVKYGLYKIASVVEQYGSFRDNVPLGGITTDNQENLFVSLGGAPHTIYKITPGGDKIQILDTISAGPGLPSGAITDMKFGPGGYLYFMRGHKTIQRFDPITKRVSAYYTLKSGSVKYGDFDNEGYLYTAGIKTGLWIIGKDSTATINTLYAQDSITAVTVANGYLYLAVRTSGGQKSIVRHSVSGGGNLGPQETVIDLTNTDYTKRVLRSISVAANGTLYIGMSNSAPLLVVTPSDGRTEKVYEAIIPPYIAQASFGSGNYLYIISGNANPAFTWTVYRVNTGTDASHK